MDDDAERGQNELIAPAPDQDVTQHASHHDKNRANDDVAGDHVVDDVADGLDELAAPAPDENPDESTVYRHESFEEDAAAEQATDHHHATVTYSDVVRHASVYGHLIFFSIFGVLARLGLQALTIYPGAPVANTDLWANVAGCLIIGFLREDRALYRWHFAQVSEKQASGASDGGEDAQAQQQQDLAAMKGSIPSYIGLAVGFCGSFTSFASVCRDSYFAIANSFDAIATSQDTLVSTSQSRPAGDSVMALLAVLIMEVGLSVGALKVGAHLAVLVEHLTKDFMVIETQRWVNSAIIVLGPGVWLGSVLMAIWPPYDAWRGQAIFALVFAPLGCILRFQLSKRMNRLLGTFPLGTFTANILGTCILGLAYDLQHSSATTNLIGSQVLQGIIDGFCGALTTVSTWVLELDTLRLRHAYVYGICSLGVAIGLLVAIMGSLQWTVGFAQPPLG